MEPSRADHHERPAGDEQPGATGRQVPRQSATDFAWATALLVTALGIGALGVVVSLLCLWDDQPTGYLFGLLFIAIGLVLLLASFFAYGWASAMGPRGRQ